MKQHAKADGEEVTKWIVVLRLSPLGILGTLQAVKCAEDKGCAEAHQVFVF